MREPSAHGRETPRIAVLGLRPFDRDHRMRKEADALAALGYDVQVVCPPPGKQPVEATEVRHVWIGPGGSFKERKLQARLRLALRGHRALRRAQRASLAADEAASSPKGCLRRAVTRVALVVTKRSYRTHRRLSRRVQGVVGPVVHHPAYWATVRPILETLQPDAVHAHDLPTLYSGARWTVSRGLPLIYDAHELELHTNRNWTRWERAVYRAYEWWGIRRASAVITVSPPIAAELAATYRVPLPTVVLNSPSANAGAVAGVRPLKEVAGVEEDTRLVVYVGGLNPSRGLDRVLDALALLPAHIHLGALGPAKPRHAEALRERADALGVAHRLHLLGVVPPEQVPAALATADASVIPLERSGRSYEYALPNKLFESVMAEVPLAVSARQEISAFVRRHRLGEVFDETDPQAVARALATVIAERPTGLQDRRALRSLQERVSWEEQTRALARLYDRILGPPGRTRRVAMLVRNTVEFDTRVRKEAETLASLGYEVRVFARSGDGLQNAENKNHVSYRRVAVRDALDEWHRTHQAALTSASRAHRAAAAGGNSLALPLLQLRVRLLDRRRRVLKLAYGRSRRALRPVASHVDLLRALREPVEAFAPQVVHAHDLNTLLAGYVLSRPVGRRLVYDAHELELHADRTWTPWKRGVQRCIETLGIRSADGVITVSPGIAEELRRTYRISRPRVLLNSPPLATADARPAADLRQLAGLGAGQRLGLYVGRLAPEARGLDKLLEAFALLSAGYHLGLMGPSMPRAEAPLRQIADNLGIGSRVHLFPPVPADLVPATIATADALLIPMPNVCRSHDLALPNKFFDAVMAGIPVGVGRLFHLQRLVEEHELGMVFDESDPSSIADVVVHLTRESFAGLSCPARLRRLQEEVAWEAQGRVLGRLYAELSGEMPEPA